MQIYMGHPVYTFYFYKEHFYKELEAEKGSKNKESQREKRLNTVPYFTVLGQIISIYRHTTYEDSIREYTGSYSGGFHAVTVIPTFRKHTTQGSLYVCIFDQKYFSSVLLMIMKL